MRNEVKQTLFYKLHESLRLRWMPEDVAQAILGAADKPQLTPAEESILRRALPRYRYTSMPREFAKADDLSKQLARASELFHVEAPPASDVDAVVNFVDSLKAMLGARSTDFKTGRAAWQERKLIGCPVGHRAYNKRFRLVARMEQKIARYREVSNLRDLARVAKSRLAHLISVEAMRDRDTACFVAYMTARLNKRSLFTNSSQERPYDEVAEMLFKRVVRESGARGGWFAIAMVHPAPEVMERLSDTERGQLLGTWYSVMVRAANVLHEQASKGGLDLDNLIVHRGNDSSTWNEAAGAFNKARDGWVSTLYALGADGLLDSFCPGKALRLMAADVAAWHRRSGGGLEPDTLVWRDLPPPWLVVLGVDKCTRRDILRACDANGVTDGKGWVRPREKSIAEFKPTPELVHGVVVSSPELAARLRECGYFAGPSKGPASGHVPIDKVEVDGTVVATPAYSVWNTRAPRA